MSTDIHSQTATTQPPEAAGEIARRASDATREAARRAAAAAKDAADTAGDAAEDAIVAGRDAAGRATDTAREMYHSASLKAGDALASSRDYVSRNPVPVVLGAIALGAAIGYLLMTARRKPTFSERYADEPLAAVRETILGALAPITQRVHKGYDSARHGAENAYDRMHDLASKRNGDSFSDQIGRIGHNLKFW